MRFVSSRGDEIGSDAAGGLLVRRRDGILQIDDQHVGIGGESLLQLPFGIAGDEEQRAHQAAGFFSIIAWRRHLATSTSCWL